MDVQRGDLIHTCFEKSAWFFVAMLAINKAGAAWVPLDPSHPLQRQQQVVKQTQSKLALASTANLALCNKLIGRALEVNALLDESLAARQEAAQFKPDSGVTPNDVAYVLFTSGSTGTPKGLVMEHRAVCTSQTAIGKRLRLTPGIRMLQFASFVFDLCIGEIIGGLVLGACLCIPSEHDRMNNLSQFICDKRVDWAYLTPAFARTLRPEDVPGLELLLLAGEAVTRDLLDTWFGKVRLVNAWGPAETCVASSLHEWTSINESPMTIGKPVAGFLWIMDPEEPTRLAPLGSVGEVMVHSPTLLRHYLADPDKTKASTVENLPDWIPKRTEPHWGRFFRTGDLCSWNPDGTVEFQSRKDTQVKIRGLRVELEEVEHHVRTALAGPRQVVVDVLRTDAGASLAAYFCFNDETRMDTQHDPSVMFLSIDGDIKAKVSTAIGKLGVSLPSYMVPTFFIPCSYMPSIASTKLDRNALKNTTLTLSQDALTHYALQDGEKQAPTTEPEQRLQQLWSAVLKVPLESIGRDDSFLRLGGDSITAIRLVSRARESGLIITVKDIFDDPRLSSIAEKMIPADGDEDIFSEVEPFSLVSQEKGMTEPRLAELCELWPGQVIEDAYPCTGLQEGLMALAAKQPGSYMARYVYRLPATVDIARFRAAWARTVEACGNLRTQIIQAEGESLQALVAGDVEWEQTAGLTLRQAMEKAQSFQMQYGTRLCRYAVIEEQKGNRYFALTIHHAVHDGWTLQLVFETLYNAYAGLDLQPLDRYAGFIRYTANLDADKAGQYWSEQLRGAKRAAFPPLSYKAGVQHSSRVMKTNIVFPASTQSSITKATILRAAWAIVLARYSDTDDVCFGVTVSGRQAPVPGLERMPGPAVATVPVRLRLNQEQPVLDFLHDVQTGAAATVPYEQFGLRNILKLGEDVSEACDFSSLLVIQPMQHTPQENGDDTLLTNTTDEEYGMEEALEGYYTYPLVVQGHVFDKGAALMLTYHADVLSQSKLENLTRHFDYVVQQLLSQDQRPLGDISLAGEWDLQQSLKWNTADSTPLETCVHELITEQAKRDPKHEAIVSSSGAAITYAELDRMSTKFAQYLAKEGVRRGTMVPICLEKSPLAILTMLAIFKAGGVYVPLDPTHPKPRRQAFIKECGARHLIVSPVTAESSLDMAPTTIELSASFLKTISSTSYNVTLDSPSYSDPAYIIFTSGSTGKPKTIFVDHSALTTSTVGRGRVYNFDNKSRVLQFSNYNFDVSLSEILETLVFGGTVCVPTTAERIASLPKFVAQHKVNTALLTTSFLRTIKPSDVPSLDLLILVGEPPTQDILNNWFDHVTLANAYGPSEICVFCTSHVYTSVTEPPTTVGSAFGSTCYIVETNDHNRLAPIGCIGELLIQRQMARGYLNDPERTTASFIKSVGFLPAPQAGDTRRFYKSGDLVRYNDNGTIEYLGRRDTQVKMHGFRIELGEIEYGVKASLPEIEYTAADVIHRDSRELLIAFSTLR